MTNIKSVPAFVGPEKPKAARKRILVDEQDLDSLLVSIQAMVAARRNNGNGTDEHTVRVDEGARRVWRDIADARYDAAAGSAPAIANGRKDGAS